MSIYDTHRFELPRTKWLKALIFDNDGTVADTLDAHALAIRNTLNELKLTRLSTINYEDMLKKGSSEGIFRFLINQYQIDNELKRSKDDIFREMYYKKTYNYVHVLEEHIKTGKIVVRKGLPELLEEAEKARVPVGMATASNPRAVGTLLDLLELSHHFKDHIVYRKTSHLAYKEVLSKLELHPQNYGNCFAIEDTCDGAEFALHAGLHVLLVQSSYTDDSPRINQLMSRGVTHPPVASDERRKLSESDRNIIITRPYPRKIDAMLSTLIARKDEGQGSILEMLDGYVGIDKP